MSWIRPQQEPQIRERDIPGPDDFVKIFHPRSPNPLISLPANDFLVDDGGVVWVLELGVALDIAFIISNNRYGYFSASRDPSHRLPPDRDYLTPGRYYYFTLDMSDSYAIVPSFTDWSPPADLPPSWKAVQSSMNTARPPSTSSTGDHLYSVCSSPQRLADLVQSRDKHTCLVTRNIEALDCCPIIPRQHSQWFQFHQMWLYNPPAHREPRTTGDGLAINSVNNALTLRVDIHHCFDSGDFAIVVKGGRIACHLLKLLHPYGQVLHGYTVPVPAGVPLEFLFARFSYTIFKRFNASEHVGLDFVSGHPDAAVPEGIQRRKGPTGSDGFDVSDENDAETAASFQSSMHDSEMARIFAKRFPHLQEVTYSSHCDWHSLWYHPETVKMHRLRNAWFEKYPNITATTGPTADLDDEAEFDDADDSALDPDELSSDPYLHDHIDAGPPGVE